MTHRRSTRRLVVMVTSAMATFEPSIQDMHAKNVDNLRRSSKRAIHHKLIADN